MEPIPYAQYTHTSPLEDQNGSTSRQSLSHKFTERTKQNTGRKNYKPKALCPGKRENMNKTWKSNATLFVALCWEWGAGVQRAHDRPCEWERNWAEPTTQTRFILSVCYHSGCQKTETNKKDKYLQWRCVTNEVFNCLTPQTDETGTHPTASRAPSTQLTASDCQQCKACTGLSRWAWPEYFAGLEHFFFPRRKDQ